MPQFLLVESYDVSVETTKDGDVPLIVELGGTSVAG
jgi:hypothetical protein